MTKLRLLLASLVVLFVLALIPSETRAYDNCVGSLMGVRGFGNSGTLYGLGYLPVPPYFAVHPPVYYGQRYFRTYGESPFARPARSSRPLNVSVQLVTNPYVEQLPAVMPSLPAEQETGADAVVVGKVTIQPQMIINPYYKVEDEVAQK